jgi:hypothetical protein
MYNNTNKVMELVLTKAKELNIKQVVVATTGGDTAMTAQKILGTQCEIIAITHATGFKMPNQQELSTTVHKNLTSQGVTILTCQHAFGGVARGIKKQLATAQAEEIMAFTLRMFGQGTKVAIEIALMAADAGLIRTDTDIIAIGGTGRGADTALLMRPANSFNVFDLKVKDGIK